VVDDKTTSQSTEAANTDPDHNSNNDSLMDDGDIENNLSAATEQSKKSEEIAECKQQ